MSLKQCVLLYRIFFYKLTILVLHNRDCTVCGTEQTHTFPHGDLAGGTNKTCEIILLFYKQTVNHRHFLWCYLSLSSVNMQVTRKQDNQITLKVN